jgi:hypothetical protein
MNPLFINPGWQEKEHAEIRKNGTNHYTGFDPAMNPPMWVGALGLREGYSPIFAAKEAVRRATFITLRKSGQSPANDYESRISDFLVAFFVAGRVIWCLRVGLQEERPAEG